MLTHAEAQRCINSYGPKDFTNSLCSNEAGMSLIKHQARAKGLGERAGSVDRTPPLVCAHTLISYFKAVSHSFLLLLSERLQFSL